MKIIYNGINLDDTIQGYETINVEGRGLFAPTLNTIEIDGRDGAYLVSQQLPARVLKVHFVIRANNSKDKMSIEEELNRLLLSESDVKIQFSDELEYYTGRYSGYNDVDYDYFQGIGTFEIYCQNPYKRSENKTLTGTSILMPKNKVTGYELVSITGTSTGSQVAVRNESKLKYIYITNLTDTGDFILTMEDIKVNDHSMRHKLDPSRTTWKKFSLSPGDTISIQGLTSPVLTYKELTL